MNDLERAIEIALDAHTGDAKFIETIAGLLKPILDLENDETRVELNLQRTKIRDTKQYTGNYALYLSVTERGGK